MTPHSQPNDKYIITEEQMNKIEKYGWIDAFIIREQVRLQLYTPEAERNKVLDKLTERIKRFEEHQVFCITRNQIWTCDKIRRFIAELRTPAPEQS